MAIKDDPQWRQTMTEEEIGTEINQVRALLRRSVNDAVALIGLSSAVREIYLEISGLVRGGKWPGVHADMEHGGNAFLESLEKWMDRAYGEQ